MMSDTGAGRPLMVPSWLKARLEEFGVAMEKAFDETKHRRYPKGHPKGGKFMPKGGGKDKGASASKQSEKGGEYSASPRGRYFSGDAAREKSEYREGLEQAASPTGIQSARYALEEAWGQISSAKKRLGQLALSPDVPEPIAAAVDDLRNKLQEMDTGLTHLFFDDDTLRRDEDEWSSLAPAELKLTKIYDRQRVDDILDDVQPWVDREEYWRWIAAADPEVLEQQFGSEGTISRKSD